MEQRKGDRRIKDGTPEQRKMLADWERAARTLIPSNGDSPKRDNSIMLGIALAFFIVIIIWCATAHSDEPIINMNKIVMIESGNRNIISNDGGYGKFQITTPVLREYNDHFINNLTLRETLDPDINRKIANWYLNIRIPKMLRHYHRKVNTRNIIICYNAGISYVVGHKRLPRTTVNYLSKYFDN